MGLPGLTGLRRLAGPLAVVSLSISAAGAAPTATRVAIIHLPALSSAQQSAANGSAAALAEYPFDYARGHRLFVPCAIRGSLIVINTRKNSVAASVSGLPHAHGVALARGLAWVSCGASNQVGEIDLIHPHVIRKLPGGSGPAAVLYDEAARLIYIGDHAGRTATLLDPDTRKIIASIPLGGQAAGAQVDPDSGLIYQCLEDTSEVVVVDPVKRRVVRRFSTGAGQHPTGLALMGRSLVCACANQKLVALDSRSGKVIAALPIGPGAHSVAIDPERRRVYIVSSGSVKITILQQQGRAGYQIAGSIPMRKTVNAIVVDPLTHLVYTIGSGEIDVLDPT